MLVALAALVDHGSVLLGLEEKLVDLYAKLLHAIQSQWAKVRVVAVVFEFLVDVHQLVRSASDLAATLRTGTEVQSACSK